MNAKSASRQRGFVLITGVVLLVALTIIGVGMIVLSTANLRTVSNMQAQIEARAVAQQVIDEVLSRDFAKSPATLGAVVRDYSVQPATDYKTYTVSIARQPCMQQFKKFSVNPKDPRASTPDYENCVQGAESYCADTLWRISADVSEGWFGANESVTQGVSMVVDVESATFHNADQFSTNKTSNDPKNPYCEATSP